MITLLYLDPGAGSYILQALIAGILGFLFFFKNAWLQIKHFFSGKKSKGRSPEQPQ